MADLTDQEVVAACARAMNLDVVEQLGELRFPNCPFERSLFNPLTDRAQAMELVETLRPHIFTTRGGNWLVYDPRSGHDSMVEESNLLRAICLCAARMQIEKEKNANG